MNEETNLNQEELLTEQVKEETIEITAETKLSELEDKHIRLMAEYDNYRKRTQKEKETLYPEAVASTVRAFLPVVDNFERALGAQTEDENYKKGIEMTYQNLMDILKKLGAEPFGEVGDAFDPNIHSGVMSVEDDSLPSETVAEVFQKGYKIGDRVLRVAMVKVTA